MNPSPYSGTKNTALAIKEEEAVAKTQGTYKAPTTSYVPPPQPPAYVAPSWATNTTTSTPSDAYGLDTVEQNRFNEAKSGSTSTLRSEEELFNDQLRKYQAEIDATNRIFSNKLQDAKRAGLEGSGSQYAQQARGGLLGSDFGNAQDRRVVDYNTAVEGGIQDEQRLAISEILGRARTGAREELAAKKLARDNDYTAYKELLTTGAERKASKTNAYAKELLAKGTTLEKLLGLDPTEFSGTGLSKQEVVNAFKEADLANKKTEADIIKAGYLSPSEKYGAGSIGEYNFYAEQEKLAGRKPISYNSYQTQDANRKASIARAGASSGSGLTPSQINSTVNSIAGSFDNEPVVKNYNVIAEGAQFANSIVNKTNPTSADDQGLVYAFAKAMDPNSAVKEGEYITIQKYNQSLVEQGFASAKRIAKNTAFLTPEARTNMIQTINSKLEAGKKSYDNVKTQYETQISNAYAGKPRTITDYSAGYTPPPSPVAPPAGQTSSGIKYTIEQ